MPGRVNRNLDPPIVPLNFALEVPAFWKANGYCLYAALLGVDECALDEAFADDGDWFRCSFGCGSRFSLGVWGGNARPSSRAGRGSGRTVRAGRRTTARVRSQPRGFFAPIGQRVLVFPEAGHDSAPTGLHSRAQLLCIVGAGGLNRSKLLLVTRLCGLRRSGMRNGRNR